MDAVIALIGTCPPGLDHPAGVRIKVLIRLTKKDALNGHEIGFNKRTIH